MLLQDPGVPLYHCCLYDLRQCGSGWGPRSQLQNWFPKQVCLLTSTGSWEKVLMFTGDLPMFMHKESLLLSQSGESGSLSGNKTTRVCLHRDLQFGLGLEVRLLRQLYSASWQTLASCCRQDLSALEKENELCGIFCPTSVPACCKLQAACVHCKQQHRVWTSSAKARRQTSNFSCFPCSVWKEPMHETQAVPETQIHVRLQCFLFLNTHLCQLFSLSPLLRLKVSWAMCELLPSERKRKEITHYAQLSRPFLIHFVYESSERDGRLMVTRDWHLPKLGFFV